MKNLEKYFTENRESMRFFRNLAFLFIILFWSSCHQKTEPYAILEFQNGEEVCNYSKSLLFSVNKPAADNTTVIMGSKGDLFLLDDFLYYFQDTAAYKSFSVRYTDSILFLNGKISCLQISGKDSVIPWIRNLIGKDLSALQMINISSDTIAGCIGDLKELAAVKPDAGIIFSGDFGRLEGILQIFQPWLIVSPVLYKSDYGKLASLTGLKILIASPGDSLMTDPLPVIPSLKHLALTEMEENAVITGDLLINNKQLERVGLGKGGTIDLSLLHPLENLKELVIAGADSLVNLEEINRHKKLEVLVLSGEDLKFKPALIHLPRLRWLTIPFSVTQDEFTTLIKNHPGLEVVEIFGNDTIYSLQPLSGLSKLSGFAVMDTLTDLATVKTMKNLKYLSLPHEMLEDSLLNAELHSALPGTKIAANDGFCLGSGWLLLLLPAVFGVRMILNLKRKWNCPS